jgi:hypothetical protein
METNFVPLSVTAHTLPDMVRTVVERIAEASPRLAALVTPQGSIKINPLRKALEPVLSPFDVTPGGGTGFAPTQIHFTGTGRRIGVSLQTGRAIANNGTLVSVLAAASSPDIDWIVAVVPELYKGTKVYPNVLEQLRELQRAHGVHLDLQGVVLISY